MYNEDDGFMRDGWLLNEDGSIDLDLYNDHQYSQNEQHFSLGANRDGLSSYNLRNFDIEDNTLSGTIYLGDTPTQTFIIRRNGMFEFTDILISDMLSKYTPFAKAKAEANGSHIDLDTGSITLKWDKQPGNHSIVVSYEYGWTSRNAIRHKKLEKIRKELDGIWLKEGF